ncbi:uncharacterized protein CDV56_106126 [Aspergillus thermomutatus]|uniref:Uncharacterized protein n=1 Tax=Aspergillus thermomutatus TaxID=41047 RepID=A0A397HD07_ASPTH|nr:uncharacterized protein CDV56_106126 [Aspergillus thermomutatus]RHZ58240.1 hypothetical protein CDV56_106126 [Aspergillus thermomutatus]
MTQHLDLPSDPLPYSGNFVTPDMDGTICISKEVFMESYLLRETAPLLNTLNQYIYSWIQPDRNIHAGQQISHPEKYLHVGPGSVKDSDSSFFRFKPVSWSSTQWRWSPPDQYTEDSPPKIKLELWTSSSSKLELHPGTNQMSLSGTTSLHFKNQDWFFVWASGCESKVTATWSINATLDSVKEGGLRISLNLPSDPSAMFDVGKPSWGEWPFGVVYPPYGEHLRANLVDALVQIPLLDVATQLQTNLTGASRFVIPGGGTFFYKDPIFSESGDLLIEAKYDGHEAEVVDQPTYMSVTCSSGLCTSSASRPLAGEAEGTGLDHRAYDDLKLLAREQLLRDFDRGRCMTRHDYREWQSTDLIMFSVNHDFELMVQHVAAVAVPKSSLFFTVADEQGNPAVFSLGTDKKFYVVQNDAYGQKQLNDLGGLLRLDASYVGHALSVSQGPGMNLFLVLAIQSTENEDASEIIVLKPFQPSEYDLSSSGSDLSGLIIPQTGQSYNQRVNSFFSVGATGSSVYPPVLVAFQPLEYLNKKEDLEQVNVSNDLGSWDLRTDVDLPEDATKILALQPLAVPFGDGTMLGQAALYIIQDEVQLIFQSPTYQVTLQVPRNATCLGSVVNADGFTDLLIGGSGLYRLEARKCLYKNSEPTRVVAESFFSSISELHVAQSPQAVTVWAEAADETVGYITTDADFSEVQHPIPVLARRQGGRFSVFKSPSLGQDQIIVSDSGGSLSLIRHDPQLGLWKPTPFYTPTLDKVVELKSYTTQIWVYNDDDSPRVDGEVLLQSSGYVDILMNGMPLQISPSGTPVVTDQEGLLTLIVPTDDISTYTFTVASTEGVSASDGAVVDPAVKVYDALSKIQTGDDLKNARLQNGDRLLESNSLDDYDLNEAAQAVAAAVSRRGATLTGQSSVTRAEPKHGMFGKNKERFYMRGGFIDMLDDAWNWLEGVFNDITAWAIEATEEFCHFWVEIAGQAYRWILNTAEMIGKAISWIFEKILEIAEKIIEWIGFILNWGDIKATHNSIVSLVNNALDMRGSSSALLTTASAHLSIMA